MAPRLADQGLDLLYRRFLDGDSASTISFHLLIRPLLRRLARKYGPHLNVDQLEEVSQQTLMLLIISGRRTYDPDRGNAATFVRLNARRAAREVSAQYAPAGRRTRPPSRRNKRALERFRYESRVASLDELPDSVMPRANDQVEAADARVDAALLLHRASPLVSQAMRRIYLEGASVAEAAKEAGVSRFALHRMIAAFCTSLRS